MARASEKRLVVLGCSDTKVPSKRPLPAVSLYDGPAFRVLRTFLREHEWPAPLSVAVISAKYGLLGGISPITTYNRRMTANRARTLHPQVTDSLCELATDHRDIDLLLGRDYLASIDMARLRSCSRTAVAEGPIGMKLNRLHTLLREFPTDLRRKRTLPNLDRPLYFLPDWDDFLDVDYDFATDTFSEKKRSERNEKHSIALVRPYKLCDGVLVSLAQHLGSKGFLKRVERVGRDSLKPNSLREHFGLARDQWAFGDCGAFSYVNESRPTISVKQAISLYELYDFDLGASVDHIPIPAIKTEEGIVELSLRERRHRIAITRRNARSFIELAKSRRCSFIPVGVIQGIDAEDYADQVDAYVDMGYRHLALGGLVPRPDDDVTNIVSLVSKKLSRFRRRPWLHLLGIFRPNLQAFFRESDVNSFDSATYFRKAWLRSGQNFLGADGEWYAAIRVPPTHDSRTFARLLESGKKKSAILAKEKMALQSLRKYDAGRLSLDKCLAAVLSYDSLLSRSTGSEPRLEAAYRRTLEARPWQDPSCPLCEDLGIEIIVFRGLNRNKRRGTHNTLKLFQQVSKRKA